MASALNNLIKSSISGEASPTFGHANANFPVYIIDRVKESISE